MEDLNDYAKIHPEFLKTEPKFDAIAQLKVYTATFRAVSTGEPFTIWKCGQRLGKSTTNQPQRRRKLNDCESARKLSIFS